MGHWAQNQASAMAIPVLWPEPCRKLVRWTEEKKHRHGAVNLERFWMKEWSLISCQVFSTLIRHYRRKCRAVKLANGGFKSIELKGAVNCGQCVLEKNIYFIMIFPPILNSYSPMKGSIFVNFLSRRSKGLTMQIHFHSLLWSYLPRVPIILTTTVYPSLCLYLYIPLSVSLSLSLSVYLSVSIYLSLFLYPYFPLSVSLPVYLSASIYLYVSISIFPSVSLCLSLCLLTYPSLCLYLLDKKTLLKTGFSVHNVMRGLPQVHYGSRTPLTSGVDWPLGAPGRFPVACRLIWPAALCFFYFLLLFIYFYLLPSQCAKVIISDCGIP